MKGFITKKVLLLILFLSALAVVLIILSPRTKETPSQDLTRPRIPEKFEPATYSSLSTFVPGKSTLDEVVSVAGEPKKREIQKEITFLTYATESLYFDNTITIKLNVIYYVLERNIGEAYKETTIEYKRSLGEPDIVLHDSEREDTFWYVYLREGVALNSSIGGVFRRLRFVPMSKEEFIKTIGTELKMEPKTIEEHEREEADTQP